MNIPGDDRGHIRRLYKNLLFKGIQSLFKLDPETAKAQLREYKQFLGPSFDLVDVAKLEIEMDEKESAKETLQSLKPFCDPIIKRLLHTNYYIDQTKDLFKILFLQIQIDKSKAIDLLYKLQTIVYNNIDPISHRLEERTTIN